jgi:hypothetical protein
MEHIRGVHKLIKCLILKKKRKRRTKPYGLNATV